MVPPTLRLAVLGGSSRPGGQGPRQPWGALACAGGHWSANTCSLVAAPASITFLCFLHGFLPWGTPRPYRQDAPRWLFLTHHCDQVAVMPFTLPDPRGCDLRSTRPQITPRWRTVCPWVELEPLLQLQTISAKGCLEQRRCRLGPRGASLHSFCSLSPSPAERTGWGGRAGGRKDERLPHFRSESTPPVRQVSHAWTPSPDDARSQWTRVWGSKGRKNTRGTCWTRGESA